MPRRVTLKATSRPCMSILLAFFACHILDISDLLRKETRARRPARPTQSVLKYLKQMTYEVSSAVLLSIRPQKGLPQARLCSIKGLYMTVRSTAEA